MSIDIAWEPLSVEEFLDNCNWVGWSPQMLSEVAEVSESIERLKFSLIDWKSLKTQDFFASNNWNGLAILPGEVDSAIAIEESHIFSLTLTNRDFWQCFSWLGPINLPSNTTSESDEVTNAAAEFTLKDLSQLF